MIGIYKITNKINGKCYIGQSVDIERRWTEHQNTGYETISGFSDGLHKRPLYQAMKKYGLDNFQYEVLEECKEQLLDEREQYYIQLYDSYITTNHNNGYNLTQGGQGIIDYEGLGQEKIQYIIDGWNNGMTILEIKQKYQFSRETITKYLKKYCPTYNTSESVKRVRTSSVISQCKPVNQYSLDKIFLNTYNSIEEASRKTNILASNISRVLSHDTRTAGGYYWIDASIKDQQTELSLLSQPIIYEHSLYTSKIEQYDKKGNYIQTYNNAEEASKVFNVNIAAFRYGCNNGRLVAGYQWKWQEDNKIITPYNRKSNTGKCIGQYSLSDELLNVYKSGAEAARALELGKNANNGITRCCRGDRQVAYNYKWKYITEEKYNEYKNK